MMMMMMMMVMMMMIMVMMLVDDDDADDDDEDDDDDGDDDHDDDGDDDDEDHMLIWFPFVSKSCSRSFGGSRGPHALCFRLRQKRPSNPRERKPVSRLSSRVLSRLPTTLNKDLLSLCGAG